MTSGETEQADRKLGTPSNRLVVMPRILLRFVGGIGLLIFLSLGTARAGEQPGEPVENGDQVEVAIEEGDRDLTFGDVLVRVKDSYVLEMNIDTDEANAAELSNRDAHGDLLYQPPDVAASASLKRRRTR
ncbi:MAG: hypothetical protein K0U98_01915 [Deltaproteobacteria bacterium]|nr:hypothetical protein [Deltaproteobacteria bacterium]